MATSTALWLACAPALTTSFASVVVVAYVLRHESVVLLALVPAAVLVLLLRLRLSSPGARARLLSGNTPYGCFNAPRTPVEFVKTLCEVWEATGRRPTVVGSGWGFFIGRVSARDAVFTHKLKGQIGEYDFLAGTELRTVQATLRKTHQLAFWSTPTMQRISIGSWLARSCHGNSGPEGKPSNYAAFEVLVVDLTSLESVRDDARIGLDWVLYDTIKQEFDKFPGKFVIAAVRFDPKRMAKDFFLKKARCDVKPSPLTGTVSTGLLDWLTNDAVLRVLFFGSARRDLAIGTTYVRAEPEDAPVYRRQCDCFGPLVPHVDPHTCSVAGTSLQLDTCSLLCGWYEKSKRGWQGIIYLSDANAFSPDPSWLVLPIVALLSTTVNFELIFVLALNMSVPLAPEVRVQRLCDSLFGVYNKVWGRSELRMGSLKDGLVFVDCVMCPCNADVLVQAIRPHVHASAVALHDSKYQGKAITDAIAKAGLLQKTPRVIFGQAH